MQACGVDCDQEQLCRPTGRSRRLEATPTTTHPQTDGGQRGRGEDEDEREWQQVTTRETIQCDDAIGWCLTPACLAWSYQMDMNTEVHSLSYLRHQNDCKTSRQR